MNLYGYRQLLIYLFSIDWVIVWYLQREDSRPHWGFCGMVQELNFPTRGLFNKQRSLDCALFCCKTRRKWLKHERSVRRNTRRVECSSRFLSALQQNTAQSRLLYLFYNKESVKFLKQTPNTTFNFQNKLYFQSEQQCLSMLYTFIKHAKISQSKSLLEWFK